MILILKQLNGFFHLICVYIDISLCGRDMRMPRKCVLAP